jgi:hypothetical protein
MGEGIRVGIFSNEKLKSNGVRTIKDQVLLAPGTWNGRRYTAEEIEKAFQKTDWEDKDVISLVADHNDDDNKGRPLTIRDWLGYVSNPRLDSDRPGFILGDLNLCDLEIATRLIDGKAPFGVSPFVYGMFDQLSKSQKDFIFKNFAIVVEPACKESYINTYLSDDELNTEISKLSIEERIKKRIGNQKLEETTPSDISGEEKESGGLQPIDYKKKKKKKKDSCSKELKGGKKMAEEEQKVEESVEKTEEATEEVKEEPKEEEKKEEAVEEEKKEEEKPEEESEEKLLDNIAKGVEKLLSKRKVTPEQAKMQELEKEISSLKERIQKLEEAKVSEVKKLDKEKLSAKPKSIAGTKLEEDTSFSFGKSNSHKGSKELAAMMGL